MEPKLQATKSTRGLILGKFLPPTRGHQYLVDFARNYVDQLTVIVGSLKSEPIPGEIRYKWVKEMFPGVTVVHITDENPQSTEEDPDCWKIWSESIRRAVPEGADIYFASESYGPGFAEYLGMRYVPVDHAREVVPVSGTQVREHPMRYWEFIPEVVRPYFLKRVCIYGPESTGKSILTAKLAKHFHTVYAAEYARGLLTLTDGKVVYEDIDKIARGHIASEEALARQANRILFSDTDLIITTIWSDVLFGKCPEWVTKKANERTYDLYLLTDVDVPWVADNQRYLPDKRQWFMDYCRTELEKRNRKYILISGSWEERLKKAINAVETLFQEK